VKEDTRWQDATSFSFCYDNPMFKVFLLFILTTLTTLVSQPLAQASDGFSGPTYRQLRQLEGYRTVMPAQGNVNMLVIPISFSDASCETIPLGCEQTRDDLNQAFFGDPTTMRWHSVASYYHASSYGQLSIQGMVADWYTPNLTAVGLSNNRALLTGQVINPALEAFATANPSLLPTFDADSDGYLDAVYFIYSLPFNPEGAQYGDQKDVFWAFVSYQGAVSNVARPTLFHYAWSSYDFMYQDGYYQRSDNGKVEWDDNNEPIFFPWRDGQGNLQVDAHVYIHEVGHLLGLQDYYSYDQSKGDWGASGALDMMDYNVGDHNGFSKSILGWATPRVVSSPQTITLAPLATVGEVVIVKATHPNTLLDEYIMLEYYRPENLNLKDSVEPYAGRYPRMFTESGVKIYHIDARIGRWKVVQGLSTFDQYVTTLSQDAQYRHQIANTNTASRSFNPNHKLIHLLEASGVNSFRHRGFATNATLFQTGDVFPVHDSFTFNDGTTFPFLITIENMQADGVTIQIASIPV
jgi:M6 family metalloprotease-like protein